MSESGTPMLRPGGHRPSYLMGLVLAVCALNACASRSANKPSDGNHRLSNEELGAEKHGRVINAQTMAGIPDVTVIATWHMASHGPSGYSTDCVLQRVVTTDAQGSYVIPSVTNELDLSLRGTRTGMTAAGPITGTTDFTWGISSFKPGFLPAGTREALGHLKDSGGMGLHLVEDLSTTQREGAAVLLKPISQVPADLTAKEQLEYLPVLVGSSQCNARGNFNQPQFQQFLQSITALVRPLPCSLPADFIFDPDLAKAFTYLVSDRPFFDRMEKSTGTWMWPEKGTTARELCNALNDTERTP